MFGGSVAVPVFEIQFIAIWRSKHGGKHNSYTEYKGHEDI